MSVAQAFLVSRYCTSTGTTSTSKAPRVFFFPKVHISKQSRPIHMEDLHIVKFGTLKVLFDGELTTWTWNHNWPALLTNASKHKFWTVLPTPILGWQSTNTQHMFRWSFQKRIALRGCLVLGLMLPLRLSGFEPLMPRCIFHQLSMRCIEEPCQAVRQTKVTMWKMLAPSSGKQDSFFFGNAIRLANINPE